MGKGNMNLNNLTAEEAEQILQVIQKDFELRQKERERLSKIEEVINEEDSKTAVLTKQQKFNENCCIRCCQTFGMIFNRKQTCQMCKLYVCKSCANYDDNIKGYNCKACLKEVELKQKSFNWFYENVGRKFKRFGSAKVVRTLYKRTDRSSKFHSDNESDSGYDPSLYSSFGQSGSVRGVKNRPPLTGVFPEIVIDNDDDQELDNGLFSPPPLDFSSNGKSFGESPNTSLEEIPVSPTRTHPVPSPRTSVTTPTQTADLEPENEKKDIYKEAFENTKRTEEAKFKVRFDNLLTEMQTSIEKASPRDGSVPESFGIHAYGDQMSKYRGQVRDMLISLSQRLELAVESFDESCANSPTLTSQKVRQIISKLVEDRLGESLDLTSDEAVSDLSSLTDDSTDQKSFEEQIAQAVIARVLEQHRQLSGIHLNLDEPRHQRHSESSNSEDRLVNDNGNFSNTEDKVVVDNRNSSNSKEKVVSRSRNSSIGEDKSRRRTKSEEVKTENNNNISDESDKNMLTAEEDEDVDEDDIDGEVVASSSETSKRGTRNTNTNHRSKSESDTSSNKSDSSQRGVVAVDEKKLLQEEFNKLRSFVQEVVPKPLYEEVSFVEEVEPEPIDESMERVEVDHEESQADFQSRFFTYDKVHDFENNSHLPDFSDLDYEYHDFGVNEIDPDLLSMNLAPIMEETEEELEEDKEEDTDWRGNWMFKGASGVNPYHNLGKKQVIGEFEMYTPEVDITPQIGNRDVEVLSDMSENDDRNSLDGLSDEENSFYAKTSEEIARITRKSSSSTQVNTGGHTPMATDGESDSESALSRHHSSSFSDSGIRGSRGLDQNSFDSRVSEKTPAVKLSEDLVPAEGDDPKFEIPPISVTVPEGEPAKLTCRVAGTQPLDLFWYRVRGEVEELENSENYEITKEGGRHHLTMYNMTKEEAGQYMCMAINEKGRCCQYFILTVKKNTQELKKPEFLKTLTDVEVTEGQSVKFRCKVKGYPQPRVIWYKDGQILLNNLNYRLERFGNRDYLLSIDCATMDEDAEYSVLAKNIAGETRASAQLIVEPKNKPESVPKTAQKKETKQSETPKGDDKPSDSPDILYDISYLPWLKKPRKPSTPESQKEDNNLTNIGQKLTMTKDSVTNVAEEMLSSSKELTEIDKSIAAMDKMLEDLESDVYSVTSEGSSDTENQSQLKSTLPEHSSILIFNNYVEVQEAAENVRKATTSALDCILSADSLVMQEKNIGAMATSTPRNSDSERVFNPDSDNSHFTCDSDVGLESAHDTSKDSHKSEMSFSMTPASMNALPSGNDTLKNDLFSSTKTVDQSESNDRTSPESQPYSLVRLAGDTDDRSDGPIKVNLGPKRENKEWYQKDFYITNTPVMQRKSPAQSPREVIQKKQEEPSQREVIAKETQDQSLMKEKERAHTEEKIYLAANNVYNLENKVQTLQDKMRAVNALSEQDKMSRLENQVAKTVAQVATTEKQVKRVEMSVSKLADPQAETKKAASIKSKQAPAAPVTQQVPPTMKQTTPTIKQAPPYMKQASPPPKPEPTFLKGETQEQDIPESRTEFNEDYSAGFELPSVSRLKAMFGKSNSSEDSSIKRRSDPVNQEPVHSITARSVPKGQLDKLKDTDADNPRSRVQVVSNPGRATALTTGQQIKSTPSAAKQVFHSTSVGSESTAIKSAHVPKQSIQVSSSAKTSNLESDQKAHKTMQLTLSTSGTNRPVSGDQSNLSSKPISSPVTKTVSVPSSSQSQGSKDKMVATGAQIDTPEERKSPKIKTGAISAMSKFWEKRLQDGVEDEAPEILEYE